jgi:hypothetical protein
MSQVFLIREKVFKARLRSLLEPVDFVVKNLTKDCVNSTGVDTPQQLFSCLKDWKEQFWSAFPHAMVIIMEWANHASAVLVTHGRPIGFFAEDLKTKIWQNFLQRLSLDSWLIIGKNNNSQGNEVLQIIMRVVNDTIYSQFPLMDDSLNMQQPVQQLPMRQSMPMQQPDAPPPEPAPSSQFETLFETSAYPRLPARSKLASVYGSKGYDNPSEETKSYDLKTYGSPAYSSGYQGQSSVAPAPVSRLGAIPELDNEGHERELALLRNSSRNVYLPRMDNRGMPIKLRRMGGKGKDKFKEGPSNKSRSRKKKSSRRRHKSKRDDDDDDDEPTSREKEDSYGVDDSDSDDE